MRCLIGVVLLFVLEARNCCNGHLSCISRQDGGNIFSGVGGDTPVMGEEGSGADTPTQQVADQGRAGQPAMPLEAPGPDRKAADLRNDAAEEERRQKLRQVCSCLHVCSFAQSEELSMLCFLETPIEPTQQQQGRIKS